MRSAFHICLSFSFGLFVSVAYGQKNQVEMDGFAGNVKQIKQSVFEAIDSMGVILKGKPSGYESTNYLYRYDSKGRLLESKKFDDRGLANINNVNTYEYNEKGLLIKKIDSGYPWVYIYNKKGKLISEAKRYTSKEGFTYAYVYSYDKKGNMIEQKALLGDSTVDAKWVFTYDGKKNQTEENYYDEHGVDETYKFKYDSKNHMIEKSWTYDSDGYAGERTTWQFDKKGNLLVTCQYNKTNSLTSKDSCVYNAKGQKLEAWFYYYGSLDSKHVYTLNDLGQVVEEKVYEKADILSRSYTYEFDSHGNWIKEIEFNPEGKPKSITVREFEYY